jgi:hypothetical protein
VTVAYTFTKQAARQIQRAVRQSEKNQPASRQPPKPLSQATCYIAKTGVGGIPARSSDTPGQALVDLYRIGADGDLLAVTDERSDSIQITVYNLSTAAVAGSVYIQVKQEAWGRYLADWEDCG